MGGGKGVLKLNILMTHTHILEMLILMKGKHIKKQSENGKKNYVREKLLCVLRGHEKWQYDVFKDLKSSLQKSPIKETIFYSRDL